MTVYALFHCDQWKSYDSYRLIGIVSKTYLKKALRKIKKECAYDDEEMETYIAIEEVNMNNLKEFDI